MFLWIMCDDTVKISLLKPIVHESMAFEEDCIKRSRRNIKKYGNGSNYSDVSQKKGRIAHNLVLDHPKSKNQSSFVR